MTTESPEELAPERTGTGPIAVALSVLAAAFGVQSSRNRKRDFQHGKLVHFVIGGLVGTAVFILVVILMVRLVMSSA